MSESQDFKPTHFLVTNYDRQNPQHSIDTAHCIPVMLISDSRFSVLNSGVPYPLFTQENWTGHPETSLSDWELDTDGVSILYRREPVDGKHTRHRQHFLVPVPQEDHSQPDISPSLDFTNPENCRQWFGLAMIFGKIKPNAVHIEPVEYKMPHTTTIQ